MHHNYVWSLTFSRDGLHLLTGSEDMIARLWDLSLAPSAGIPLTRIDPELDLLAFESQLPTPRYKTVITGDRGRPVPPGCASTSRRRSARTVATSSSVASTTRRGSSRSRRAGESSRPSATTTGCARSPTAPTIGGS